MEENRLHYYIFQVVTGKELEVIRWVSKQWSDLGERILYPRRKIKQRSKGQVYWQEVPLYPGYLILKDTISPTEYLDDLRKIPNFIRFLPNNQSIMPLCGEEERFLHQLLSADGLIGSSKASFDANQRIVILSGPLKGMEGKIVKIDKRKGRARVILDFYKESHPIDFSVEFLSPNDSARK